MDHVHNVDPRPRHHAVGLLVALAFASLLAGCSSSSTAPPIPTTEVPLSLLNITVDADTFQVGSTRTFVAQAYDTLGALLGNQTIHWSTSDPGVITIGTSGVASAVGEGSAWVHAVSGGQSDSASVYVYPDTGWYVQPSAANGANLYGVYFRPDGRSGWAVGNGGKIISTSDAGVHWAVQISNTAFTLNGVWFTSDQDGWACGTNGTVLSTNDAGVTWTWLSNVATGAILKDIAFADANHGWACGSNGTIVSTIDGGANWTVSTLSTSSTFNGISFHGISDVWAVGDGGFIAGTHDGGTSWYLLTGLTSQPLRSVWRLDDSHALAVGQQGTVLATSAGPDSVVWSLEPSVGASNNLFGVFLVDLQLGYMVGFNAGGLVLRTDDGGVNWMPQQARTTLQLNDVYFVDRLRGWAVGNGGTVVHTATGGQRR